VGLQAFIILATLHFVQLILVINNLYFDFDLLKALCIFGLWSVTGVVSRVLSSLMRNYGLAWCLVYVV